ncbi:Txe/YoeB family addiction module toxin [Siccirubricoccus phaeus]
MVFTDLGWDDYLSWQDQDLEILAKINELINDARRSPFKGLGKPEPLKASLQGFWSRRITREHRLVYCVDGKGLEQQITIIQCRHHY